LKKLKFQINEVIVRKAIDQRIRNHQIMLKEVDFNHYNLQMLAQHLPLKQKTI